MYILCNEEPLWMTKCLSIGGPLEYKGSWKKTTLCRYVQIQALQHLAMFHLFMLAILSCKL